MTNRVFNFGAGPAMLPEPVMQRARDEFLDYKGIGASVIEISHRSRDFMDIVEAADALFRELAAIPENYRILYVHGGAQMQFSAIPMNLIARNPARKAAYAVSGNFANLAAKEATRYGEIDTSCSSAETNFDRIPELDTRTVDAEFSYVHITSNNTIYGTRWHAFPNTGDIPLVADMTSNCCPGNWTSVRFGVIFARCKGTSGFRLGPGIIVKICSIQPCRKRPAWLITDRPTKQSLPTPSKPSPLHDETCAGRLARRRAASKSSSGAMRKRPRFCTMRSTAAISIRSAPCA